ncbi:hypothetical protein ACNOYE_13235 [Nannocystaceae bacterium ST9]
MLGEVLKDNLRDELRARADRSRRLGQSARYLDNALVIMIIVSGLIVTVTTGTIAMVRDHGRWLEIIAALSAPLALAATQIRDRMKPSLRAQMYNVHAARTEGLFRALRDGTSTEAQVSENFTNAEVKFEVWWTQAFGKTREKGEEG